jgi:hypothetical protein
VVAAQEGAASVWVPAAAAAADDDDDDGMLKMALNHQK